MPTYRPAPAIIRALWFAALLFGTAASQADDFFYTVQAGDHPSNIARRYFKNPSYALRLAQLNKIPNDRRIQPGTQLRIPEEWLKLQAFRVRLLAVNGDALLSTASGGNRAAAQGDVLEPGTSLRTGARASATLEFEDGSRVLVRQNTEVRLVSSQKPLLHNGRLVELELLRGGLENAVTPVTGQPGRFEIRSPSALAAVRGTQFRVSATTGQTWTEVLEGAVLVSNAAGQSPTSSGSGSLTGAGQAPGAPTPLLAAPDLSTLPQRLERLPMDWPVPPVAGSVRYRTELAPDDRFELLLSDEVTDSARARVLEVADASYVLRIRGIDANGLEGLVASRPLVVYARPEPPLLIEPAPDAVTVSERPAFRWTQRDTRFNYRLQIAPVGDGSAVRPLDQTVVAAGGSVAAADLPAGLYTWRVAAIEPATARQGPWGDSQSFRRVLPGPDVGAAQIAPGGITLRWSVQPHIRSYRLQVARDPAFANPSVNAEADIPQMALEPLAPGQYHVRVQSVGEDAYVGPWGAPQTFVVPEEPAPQHWKALLILLPLLLLGL